MLVVDKKTKWQDAVKRFRKGDPVWTIELGGMGPGYEQALQLILWAIMAEWDADRPLPEPQGNSFPEEFNKHVDAVIERHDKSLGGLSGAQVGAAKNTAWQFMRQGYGEMIVKAREEDRTIMFDTFWPKLAS